jgi:hypothetical protein
MRRLSLFAVCLTCSIGCLAVAPLPPTERQPDEKPPADHIDCFPGAIYRKAVSSEDVWTGIDAVLVLPTFTPDPERLDEKNKRPLDNPSSYLGGRAGETEIDAGVSWEVIKEPDGTVSTQRKAFRPFWRNKTWSTGPAKPEMYFYPGDTIRMKCWTDSANKLKIRFELLARDGKPESPTPIGIHEVEFDAPGFGPGKVQQFKRVTAIDQVRNEGKPAKPTNARVENANWLRVDLLRGDDDRRPFTADRFTDMRCPSTDLVKVTPSDSAAGGEKIDLSGR